MKCKFFPTALYGPIWPSPSYLSSFIKQNFIEHLLCAKLKDYIAENKENKNSCSYETYSSGSREIINKTEKYIIENIQEL